ncbi:nucleotidyltransferase family protein [Leptospira sp. WS92.C1]
MKKSLILSVDSTLDEALRILDENGNGTLTVVDENGRLVGLITDGDIRRGVLNRKTDLKDFINYEPLTLKESVPRVEALKILRSAHKRQIPLVDEQGILKDILILDDFEFRPRTNWVVIMAGGLGTRLGDLTKDLPKPMLKIGNKPILENIITSFRDFGFHRFILCLNYKSEIIKEYFGDGSKWGVTIDYTLEEKRLGTAGALSLVSSKMEESFFVTNADILTTVDFTNFFDFHNRTEAVASVCIKKIQYQIPFAKINFDKENFITDIFEKPTFEYFANAGIYLFRPEVLKLLTYNEYFDMPDLLQKIKNLNNGLNAFVMDDYWLDIGRNDDYQRANDDFRIEI